jgi:hypothetical protein
VSGVNLTSEQSTEEARRKIARYRATEQEAAQMLANTVIAEHLSVDQIRTLLFASGQPEIITILENIRDLVGVPASRASEEMVPQLEVAEGT